MSKDIYHPYLKGNQSNEQKITVAKNQCSIKLFINFYSQSKDSSFIDSQWR